MKLYTKKEEVLNTLSHFLGVIIGIFLIPVVINSDINQQMKIVELIYLIGLILMFLSSSIYHYFGINFEKYQKILPLFKRIDHAMIFVFIFLTYLPFNMFLDTTKSKIIQLVVGIVCLVGIILKIFLAGKFKKVFTLIYVVVGWAAIFEINDLYTMINHMSLLFLVLGGVTYTIGALFYALAKFKYHHFVWHLFVLVACFLQFIGVYLLYE